MLIGVSVALTILLFPASPNTDAAGFTFGTLAIVCMGWSFMLSTRLLFLELVFGGFDALHVWHRWAGIAAVAFLYLHANAENNVEAGVVPFTQGAEEAGLSVAGLAQNLLVVLVVISVLRVLPYRIWRWSHLMLIVPFVFSSFHAVTAERPLTQFEVTGYWLWFWSILGAAAFLYRVFVVDSGFFDFKSRITSVTLTDTSIALAFSGPETLNRFRPGQFVYLRLGSFWREAHPFSVMTTEEGEAIVNVEMRRAGDWVESVATLASAGDTVFVSRAHGHLKLESAAQSHTVWIAGGSGITPFLQSETILRGLRNPPSLVYFFRREEDAIGLDFLKEMNAKELLTLHLVQTDGSGVRNMKPVVSLLNRQSHVAVCGPRTLVVAMLKLARKARVKSVSFELFDYRSPFGPNLNPLLKSLIQFVTPRRWFAKLNWLFDPQLQPEKSTG